MMLEYEVLWNVNVLFDENKHRFFKKTVLSINHRKSLRQVLLKEVIIFTLKWLLNEFFLHNVMKISHQMIRLRQQCSFLLKSLVFHDESHDDSFDDNCRILLQSQTHINSVVRKKIKTIYIKDQELSVKINKTTCSIFVQLMRKALTEYDLHDLTWEDQILHWFEMCSFTDNVTQKRVSFHINDLIQLRTDEYSQLCRIFTHSMQYEKIRRMFFWIRTLNRLSHRNELLNMNLYQLTKINRIVSLSSFQAEKSYMIRVDSKNINSTCKDDVNFLHCTWNINFL
jgi:hypothetical protein